MAKSPAYLKYRMPYSKAVDAMLYAEWSVADIRTLLSDMWMNLPPSGQSDPIVGACRAITHAKKPTKRKTITHTLRKNELDPVLAWAKDTAAKRSSDARTSVLRVIQGSRNLGLRSKIDVLLYLETYSPEQIVRIIENSPSPPAHAWTAEDITLYREFFWNCPTMLPSDWSIYCGWNIQPKLRYLGHIDQGDRTALLHAVGLPAGLPMNQILQRMGEQCFSLAEQSLNSAQVLPGNQFYMNMYRTMAQVERSKGNVGAGDKARVLDATIRRLGLAIDGSQAPPEAISTDEFDGEIGSNEGVEQIDIVIQAQANGFEGFEDLMDGVSARSLEED